MDRLAINTTQNVNIEYEAAGIGDRAIATIIDMIIILSYLSTAFLIAGDSPSIGLATVISLPFVFYFLLSEIILNGQTIGKRARQIKVTRIDGTEPRLGDYVIRWLFRFVEVDVTFGLIALLTLFAKGKGQRLGDMAAGTAVVKVKKQVALSDTLYQEIDENYVVTLLQADQLSHQDVLLAREVLDTIKRERGSEHTIALADKMKATLERKMNSSSDLPSVSFLQTIIKDYNYLKR